LTECSGDRENFYKCRSLAKDSLYIFIETTANIADINLSDFCTRIKFSLRRQSTKHELVTLIQDAVFLYPQRFADGTTEHSIGDKKLMVLFG
jgi:hypothetical protein